MISSDLDFKAMYIPMTATSHRQIRPGSLLSFHPGQKTFMGFPADAAWLLLVGS